MNFGSGNSRSRKLLRGMLAALSFLFLQRGSFCSLLAPTYLYLMSSLTTNTHIHIRNFVDGYITWNNIAYLVVKQIQKNTRQLSAQGALLCELSWITIFKPGKRLPQLFSNIRSQVSRKYNERAPKSIMKEHPNERGAHNLDTLVVVEWGSHLLVLFGNALEARPSPPRAVSHQ